MVSDQFYMQLALEEARKAYEIDEVPVGAVIAKEGDILSKAHNLRETMYDPTAHAEIIAIKEASKKTKNWRLTGVTLYVTKEPCLMCAGAILNARVARLVYGCKDEKGGAVESLYSLLSDKRFNHQVEVVSGVMAEECSDMLRRFFCIKRNEKHL